MFQAVYLRMRLHKLCLNYHYRFELKHVDGDKLYNILYNYTQNVERGHTIASYYSGLETYSISMPMLALQYSRASYTSGKKN